MSGKFRNNSASHGLQRIASGDHRLDRGLRNEDSDRIGLATCRTAGLAKAEARQRSRFRSPSFPALSALAAFFQVSLFILSFLCAFAALREIFPAFVLL